MFNVFMKQEVTNIVKTTTTAFTSWETIFFK